MAWNRFLELLSESPSPESEEAAVKAVAQLYHALFTGLLLQVTLKAGEEAAGAVTFKVFRALHHDKFLSSFDKLGLSGLPDPIAAAQYHYLSNSIGGVEVEFMPENDDKAWVRFCHPRWLYAGTAICGMPLSVSRGFLEGWYAHNGVSLGNDRMGFVCVSEDMTAEIGMCGYFKTFDRPLKDNERLQFARGERPPRFDASKAPELNEASWPRARLLKANRNYAMDYIRAAIPALQDVLSEEEAAAIFSHTAALIGRQYYRALQDIMGSDRRGQDAITLADLWLRLTKAAGDSATYKGVPRAGCGAGALEMSQNSWHLASRGQIQSEAMAKAWTYLFEGMVNVHNHFLDLDVKIDFDTEQPGETSFKWYLAP